MAKKKVTIIEFRFDKSEPWSEYSRTSVAGMVEFYLNNARTEFPGAEVRKRVL
jgi:hypothetical protein